MTLFRFLFIVIFLFISSKTISQSNDDFIGDLISMYYSELNEKVKSEHAKKIIELGKLNKDTVARLTGHFLMAQLELNQNRIGLAHSDSVIILSSLKPNIYHPSMAYMKKGDIYFDDKDFLKSFENYQKSLLYAEKYLNEDLLFRANYRIAILKNRVEDYEGAIDLFKRNIDSISVSVTNSSYLLSLFGLADAQMHLKNIDSARYYNNLGLKRAKLTNNNMHNFFLMNDGYINYHLKNYQIAIEKLSDLDSFLIKEKDLINFSQSNFYQGNSYLYLKDTLKGFKKFRIVDSIFEVQRDLTPEIRSMYPILINYYNKSNQLDLELYYSKRLAKLDSIINSYNLSLIKGIYKNHDLPKIIEEKNNQLAVFEKRNQVSGKLIIIIIISLVSILVFSIFQFNKKRKLKVRLDDLIKNNNQNSLKFNKGEVRSNSTKISKATIQKISDSLDKFELNSGFLDSNITIQILSKEMNTNPKYLSYVINRKKNLTFSSYLNLLRVQHAIDRLKKDKLFRNYTIKAIALESGYNNPASFSNAFQKMTKVKPSVFIRELNKRVK